ncbi:MAG: TIGR03617 family F420-dependent LLM class oxidoreductase [Acetobacteraceae bacterium]|nr:TIGR03617 family F420-dependent LLM class oxidoreductase [Acetobacteraceae bacterium]
MIVTTHIPLRNWTEIGPAARQAEADGFDAISFPEIRHDPFAAAALATVATERIRLVTSVAIAFPRSPMVVAHSAWDLARNSGGRFTLGLGSQVRAHNERRFSVPWSSPAARMGEYVEALRAIFRTWQSREKLNYQGKHYQFTLMTPEFSPGPQDVPAPPISIAAVGPLMLRTAARTSDGARLHGFATRRYLEEVVRPVIAAELARAGKTWEHFEVSGGGFIVTGPDERSVAAAAEGIRYRIAFYGSTPQYRVVFEQHGIGELGDKLNAMSRKGEWNDMAREISDDVLDLFVARATYDNLPRALEARFGGVVDSVSFEFLPDDPPELRRRVVASVKEVPHRFQGFVRAG